MDIENLHLDHLLEKMDGRTIATHLKELNRIFVQERHRLGMYGDNPSLVSAYAAYYMPTNMLKMDFMLSSARDLPWSAKEDIEIIDVGCGPGTYSFAFYRNLLPGTSARFHFVDSSALMIQQAKKIRDGMFREMDAFFHESVPVLPQRGFRVAIFGNVLNELKAGKFETLVRNIDADAVILIEPGTPASFDLASRARRFMLRKKYSCTYPCPANGKSPALARGGEWCHQVLRSSLDPALERLGQFAGLDRKIMPFIGHLYAKGESSVDDFAQIYRLKKNLKHAFHWQLCVSNGSLKILDVELPKRGLSKSRIKAFEEICAGQYVRIDKKEELGNGTFRIWATIP